jgi:hypothetical protein
MTLKWLSFPPQQIRWAVTNQLARRGRPGYAGQAHIHVHREPVDKWISELNPFGIKSIICVLDEDLLKLYADLPGGLLSYFQENGLIVEHIPLPDSQWPPPLGFYYSKGFKRVFRAVKQLPKPVLLLCNTGWDADEEELEEEFDEEFELEFIKEFKDGVTAIGEFFRVK